MPGPRPASYLASQPSALPGAGRRASPRRASPVPPRTCQAGSPPLWTSDSVRRECVIGSSTARDVRAPTAAAPVIAPSPAASRRALTDLREWDGPWIPPNPWRVVPTGRASPGCGWVRTEPETGVRAANSCKGRRLWAGQAGEYCSGPWAAKCISDQVRAAGFRLT